MLPIFQLLFLGHRWTAYKYACFAREAPFKRVLGLLTFNLRLRREHARWPISHAFHHLLSSEEPEECGVSVVSFRWIRMMSRRYPSKSGKHTLCVPLSHFFVLNDSFDPRELGDYSYLCIVAPKNCCCLYNIFAYG